MSRYRYRIAYNKVLKTVDVFPENDAPASNSMYIGEFHIDNPKAPFEDYREDLSKAIEDAMVYVGQPDLTGWEVRVKTWEKDTNWIVAKEREPVNVAEDTPGTEVPVTEGITIAEAAHREQSGDLVKTSEDDKAKAKKGNKGG